MGSENGSARKYILSDGELALFANSLATVMTRDLTEFATYSVTNLVIDSFKDLIDEFQAMPNDELLRADLSYAVEQREVAKNSVLNFMRSISFRAKAVFGENSAKFRSMSPGSLSQLTESNLLIAANQVHSAANSSLAQLAAEGVTADYLDDFQTAIEDYESAINLVNDKKIERDTGTENKILKGNELYALVVKYCDYGKLIWDGVSEAKYNDYIIYTSTSPGTLTAPTNLVFNYSSKVLWWDVVDNATSYQLQWWNGSDFEELYAGSDINFGFTPPDGLNKFRVRAHNAGGYGPWSDVLEQYYFAVLPKAANLQIVQSGTIPTEGELTWNAVPTAVSYKIYQSVDNLGEYAAHWLVIGTVTEPLKSVTLTLGKRNSFKIETNNTYQTSMSDPVYIEV